MLLRMKAYGFSKIPTFLQVDIAHLIARAWTRQLHGHENVFKIGWTDLSM